MIQSSHHSRRPVLSLQYSRRPRKTVAKLVRPQDTPSSSGPLSCSDESAIFWTAIVIGASKPGTVYKTEAVENGYKRWSSRL
jgi:hypothetical protein